MTKNNDKPKYDSKNFRLTKDDVKKVFDVLSKSLQIDDNLCKKDSKKAGTKKLLDAYAKRVDSAIEMAKNTMLDLLTNDNQDAQTNRAARNIFLHAKSEADDKELTQDALAFVMKHLNDEKAEKLIHTEIIPNKKKDRKTVKVSFPPHATHNIASKSVKSTFFANLSKKEVNTNSATDTDTDTTNDSDISPQTKKLSWSVVKEIPAFMMGHKKKLEEKAATIRTKYNKNTRIKNENGVLVLATKVRGKTWTNIDKDTDIEKTDLDEILGLETGYKKTETKEIVLTRFESDLESDLPKLE